MFESAALEKFFKFPLYITRRFLALLCHKSCKCRLNLIDDSVEQRLILLGIAWINRRTPVPAKDRVQAYR